MGWDTHIISENAWLIIIIIMNYRFESFSPYQEPQTLQRIDETLAKSRKIVQESIELTKRTASRRVQHDGPQYNMPLIPPKTPEQFADPVTFYEERILDLQEAKRGLADAVLGTEGGFIRSLSADELRGLFESA